MQRIILQKFFFFSARKSAVFPKRNSSEALINNSNTSLNDKENNKPSIVSQTQKPTSLFSNKAEEKSKIIESKGPGFESKPVTTKSSSNNELPNTVLTSPVTESHKNITSEVSKITPEVTKITRDFTKKLPPSPTQSPTQDSSAKVEVAKVAKVEVTKVIPEVAKVTSAIGWKPSILQSNSSVEETLQPQEELSLEQRVSIAKVGVY